MSNPDGKLAIVIGLIPLIFFAVMAFVPFLPIVCGIGAIVLGVKAGSTTGIIGAIIGFVELLYFGALLLGV
jgi:hypothetical protein